MNNFAKSIRKVPNNFAVTFITFKLSLHIVEKKKSNPKRRHLAAILGEIRAKIDLTLYKYRSIEMQIKIDDAFQFICV